ncbi:ankyrin repeat-containing protein At5g02620-like [Salvia miltiorrhiza]|uniref:ankyrin repeat-containing protein At5g02620-like n=1 Tax=Salvia miltiorrhiza TaxID=226208 RepID=UPI0025AD64CD|nr:ankyrin repeat-containing protein At5g02620-like [Salvia miltiorrhiza]XP_057781670.1 ankyrin repeat-containing protein At5g02620-like [Salvia miltiorrhiza]
MERQPPPPATPRKKIVKQLTGKREDTALHSAARAGRIEAIRSIIDGAGGEDELGDFLTKRNSAGETPLFVAAEYGYMEVVREMIKHYSLADAGIKAKNGFDALHIAAKQGDLEVVKVLMEAHPELSMTVDSSNTTALHTAATQGHIEIVEYFLESESNLAAIAKSNGKTALHSAARNGHVRVVDALLDKEPGITTRTDKKGQTALHMAVKGQNVEVVEKLIAADPSTINMVDTKGNTALHIAARKGRAQIVKMLLDHNETNTKLVNRSNETALDTAEKLGQAEAAAVLQEHGVVTVRAMKPEPARRARELKQTVSDIKHEVHHQLEHTRQTRRRVQGIVKRLDKMHAEGLNNAINSTTVVAVLIATVAFAAIFTVPGEYADDPQNLAPGLSLGEANVAPQLPFLIFFLFDSFALFISLAVVVVQTSVVVIESKAKKQMMAIINKLMWLACVLISVAYLALAFIVVGRQEKWLAIAVALIGTTILATTLGTMIYWVIVHRIETKKKRSLRRKSSRISHGSRSMSITLLSDSDVLNADCKKMYAI